jgi:SLT domain-containing protein
LAEGGIVDSPTYALIGEAGPEAVIPLNESFGDALRDVGAGNFGSSSSSTVNEGSQTVTIQMTSNPSISIGTLSGNASLQEIISAVTQAVNNGIAQPLVDALNRAFAEKQRRRS